MSQVVRVRFESRIAGFDRGEVADLVRTRLITGLIANNYATLLEVLEDDDPGNLGVVNADFAVAVAAVPPRTGKGSGIDAWRAFLGGQNLPFPGDATRDALIELWDAEAIRRGL